MVVLIVLLVRSRRELPYVERIIWIESGAIYWHMVDLLWLMLFPLLYLLRA
jgi:nitric oxide reductase NorE protein